MQNLYILNKTKKLFISCRLTMLNVELNASLFCSCQSSSSFFLKNSWKQWRLSGGNLSYARVRPHLHLGQKSPMPNEK